MLVHRPLRFHHSPPPPGPPWDLPVGQAPLAFVDLEMTGLDEVEDRIVELCIQRVTGGQCVDEISTLVHPTVRMGGAAHVHGLDASMLLGAPPFGLIADRVRDVLAGAILIGHAAVCDVAFLTAEFARIGQETLVSPYYLDTLILARRAFAFPKMSLDALCKEFEIERVRAHRAQEDVKALRAVFEHCIRALAPVSARDLWEVRVAERQARPAILQACVAAAREGAPVTMAYRPCRRAPETFLFVVQKVCSELKPPFVLGYQLPTRSHRELRADRILRVEPTLSIPSPPPHPLLK